jgi:hypothetical protein
MSYSSSIGFARLDCREQRNDSIVSYATARIYSLDGYIGVAQHFLRRAVITPPASALVHRTGMKGQEERISQISHSAPRGADYRIFTLFRMDIPAFVWYNQHNQKEAFQICKFKWGMLLPLALIQSFSSRPA